MNSETHRSLTPEERELFERGVIRIQEDIPTGRVRSNGVLMDKADAVMAAKLREERAFHGLGGSKVRSGYTKPGQQRRDVAKAKSARAARKRNRGR